MMNYLSTRNKDIRMAAAQAIAKGLAPDGGLMTPQVLPRLSANALESMYQLCPGGLWWGEILP